MANDLEGISITELSEDEKAKMRRFGEAKLNQYPVIKIPAGKKHQIVHDGKEYLGVAISRNGRKDFRCYDFPVSYTKTCDNYFFPRRLDDS